MNSIAQYQHQQPALSIEKFFSGSTKGYGMVQKNSGAVRRRFTVQMSGQWHGKQGTLAEVFTYDDGEEQRRQWQITQLDAHHFNAVAKDVVGIAKGEQYGSAIHMIYTLEIPYQGTTIQMNIDDWLYRIDDHVVLNNATMKKFCRVSHAAARAKLVAYGSFYFYARRLSGDWLGWRKSSSTGIFGCDL